MGALEGLKGSRYVYDEELCVSVKLPTCSRSSGNPHGLFIYGGLAVHVTQSGTPSWNLGGKGNLGKGRKPSFCEKDRAWPWGLEWG